MKVKCPICGKEYVIEGKKVEAGAHVTCYACIREKFEPRNEDA